MIQGSRSHHLAYYRGRVALYAILKGLDVKRDDHVATQAFTCVAVPEAIIATGARPIYVDIEPDGFNMDATDLARKITPHTRAVVIQHTFGIPARLSELHEVARHYRIPIIEDCCHTHDTLYNGQRIGHLGVASFYSFEWGKPVVVGLGGSAIVRDEELLSRMESQYTKFVAPGIVRQCKINIQALFYNLLYRPACYWRLRNLFHVLSRIGAAEGNYRPVVADSDIAMDFGMRMADCHKRAMVKRIHENPRRTRNSIQLVEQYRTRIKSARLVHPRVASDCLPVYARYPLRAARKAAVLNKARKCNIELADWYSSPVHPLTYQALGSVGYQSDSCPNAEVRAGEVISLPTHMRVSQRYVDKVTEFLNRAA